MHILTRVLVAKQNPRFQNEKNMTIIAIVLMVLQIAVFIPGLGVALNGARGWINIPFLPSIQPAELFKL